MDPEIIGALIAALATIIAAIISGRVAVKIKNMELKTKKVKGRELVTKAETQPLQWLWATGGAAIGGGLVLFISILILFPIPDFLTIKPNITATPTVDHFDGIKAPLVFEFTITNRYSKPDNCSAREYTADLASGTHFLMEYQLKSVSPEYFYAFEISGPDYAEPFRLEGVNNYLIDRTITKAGKYRIVFLYCAAYTLNGTLKISEGDWSVINIEVESTPQP